jgi:hypothetical protein
MIIKQMLESRAAASGAVIEGQAVEVLAAKPLRGSARLLQHVDSSVGTAASDRQRERRRSMKEKKQKANAATVQFTAPEDDHKT